MKPIPGPDPDTRTPSFKAPAGACDAHCHVFGPASRFPYAADRSYTPPDAPREALAALHAKLGLERAVIVHASCHGTDNAATLDALEWAGGRWRAVAVIDDQFSEAELARMHDIGVRGARFNFVQHLGGRPEQKVFDRVVAQLVELGWHLVLHLDAKDIEELAPMCRKLPVPFIIDHMGRVVAKQGVEQPAFQALLGLMQLDNAWVKVCGSERVSTEGPPFTDAVPFARALVEAAPDRVLWGTDWPHPNVKWMPNDGDLTGLIPLIAPTAALQQALLVDNPQRLYGFSA